MARNPRLRVPGGFSHVRLRGNPGQDIFFSKAFRRRSLDLDLPAEDTARFGPAFKNSIIQ